MSEANARADGSATFVVETHGLNKAYPGVSALKALDLKVPQNSIFGFLGPNGSGKTTTIKILLGLARPTGGSASVFGLDCVRDSTAIRRRVGYLAQDARYYEHMTARETLRFTARFFYSGPRTAIEQRVEEMLDLVGLSERADRPLKGFSGGERQRLGIAQAQINYPDLLILDEPAASLDPQGRHDVLAVMERLRGSTTIFYSTHILSDVQRVSDRVAILNKGQLVAQAPIGELLSGGGEGATYTVTVKGDEQALSAAQRRLRAEPWVSAIEVVARNGAVHWQVGVTDEVLAETRLLTLVLATGDVRVSEFARRRYDLEEIFLDIVEASNGR